MNESTLRVLEYGEVLRRLVEQTSNTLGRERAEAVQPSIREEEVRAWLRQTTEAARLFALPGSVPLGGIHDIRLHLRIAGREGTLDPSALVAVADTAGAARKLRGFLLQREEEAPALAELARRVDEFPHLEKAVREAITEQAEVRDDASPVLERLRRELRVIRNRMTERIHSILRSPAYKDMIQDAVITTRDGRYCIPVKVEYRVQFGGLVHDQSASGSTVFMEPQAVVELGNELRQVELREKHEVERILRQLSALVGKHADHFTETLGTLGELDLVFARGKLALAMDAVEPLINKEGFIGVRRGRHPLLTGHVVPIDLDLGRENRVLVITGPNTGGKTVALKTIGLFCLMAQTGLHIPAHEGSTLPVFRGLYADIGDEQSIQQSLSTFSGHITNIAEILRGVEFTGQRSLVLLDEAGAGTDPTEGAALAKSILMALLHKGARVISTTHYGELKEFAYSTDGVQNASVEFDLATLRPTYRLLVGTPGASNAFTIAARLGLPEGVVQAARGMIGSDRVMLSEVIQKLTDDQRAQEQDVRKAAKAARDIEHKQAQYAKDLERLRQERVDILSRARAEADETLRTARRELDALREEMRRLERETRKSIQEGGSETDLQKFRERLTELTQRVERRALKVERRTDANLQRPPRVLKKRAPQPKEEEAVVPPAAPTRAPEPGDVIWIAGLNQRGTLLAPPSGGKAQVQIGVMRTSVPEENIQLILTPAPVRAASVPAAAARATDLRMQARTNVSQEVNLRGMRAEEAMTKLEEYVDQVCLAGLSPCRIVHGKGTGALKKVVWEYLRAHPNVSGYHHPSEEEGGHGVTVVQLRD